MIEETVYQHYLAALLAGRRVECHRMVQGLLEAGIDILELYTALFQQSMYRVGELWETNRITVANEHLSTSITESLLNLAYPSIFATERTGRKAVISCCANEFHQMGGKMVADVFELCGWDGYFLGANSPPEDTAKYIQEVQPDVVGLSLSILSNIDRLKQHIEIIRAHFPNMDILVGGQAFRWGGIDMINQYAGTEYISSLNDLEKMIKGM